MATGRNSDVVPLRKETKRRLDELRGSMTYDMVVQRLLPSDDRLPPPPPEPRALSPERHPEEQLLIARLAAERWRLWRRDGRIRDLGPRLVEYRVGDARPEVRYVVSRRRGLAP